MGFFTRTYVGPLNISGKIVLLSFLPILIIVIALVIFGIPE